MERFSIKGDYVWSNDALSISQDENKDLYLEIYDEQGRGGSIKLKPEKIKELKAYIKKLKIK